jgi:hypothetical protein
LWSIFTDRNRLEARRSVWFSMRYAISKLV